MEEGASRLSLWSLSIHMSRDLYSKVRHVWVFCCFLLVRKTCLTAGCFVSRFKLCFNFTQLRSFALTQLQLELMLHGARRSLKQEKEQKDENHTLS